MCCQLTSTFMERLEMLLSEQIIRVSLKRIFSWDDDNNKKVNYFYKITS